MRGGGGPFAILEQKIVCALARCLELGVRRASVLGNGRLVGMVCSGIALGICAAYLGLESGLSRQRR